MLIGSPDLHVHFDLLSLLWRKDTEEEDKTLPCLLPCCHRHPLPDQSWGGLGTVQLHAFSVSTIFLSAEQPGLGVLLSGASWCHCHGHCSNFLHFAH